MPPLYWSVALICLVGCPLEAERNDDKPTDSAEPTDSGDTACTTQTFWFDGDGDGFGDATAASIEECELPLGYADNSTDCDDSAGDVYPGAAEVCDGLDNDCEGTVDESAIDAPTWYQDLDADGLGDDDQTVATCVAPDDYVATGGDCQPFDSSVTTGETWFIDGDGDGWGAEAVTACEQPLGSVPFEGDCDDTDPAMNPGSAELCNGLDEDCDSEIDEEATDSLIWYADQDGDGYGVVSETAMACEQPEGFVESSTDCDDSTPVISPGAAETCSGLDDDCDGLVDGEDPDLVGVAIWYLDVDGDGHGLASDLISACDQPLGYAMDGDDCDDLNASTFPGADETCEGTDEDCDGDTDESAIDAAIWYADRDADSYGDPTASLADCEQPANYVENSDDCDDNDGATSPKGVETCDGFDQDCDGEIDEAVWYADTDGDGYGDPNSMDTTCVMPIDHVADWNDCDDTDATISPDGVEACGGADEDCDGAVDETCGEIVTLDGIDFVNVAAGTFEMGCTSGQSGCLSHETLHTVTLTQDYYVSETEVTQAQFEDLMGYNPSILTSCGDDCPVESLDWHESAAFANALSAVAGLEVCYTCTGSGSSTECAATMDPYVCDGYRLLTEAEWEGAARCGEDLLYAGSVTVGDVAWYLDNSSGTAHEVGALQPNACGLYDMSGNAWEWTHDGYGTLSSSATSDPAGDSAGSARVFRGGAWSYGASYARVAHRDYDVPTTTSSSLGFRVARSNPAVVTIDGIYFVNISASTFEMGCTSGQSSCDSVDTLHTVTLTQDYYVSETEVTQAQFENVMGYNPSYFSSCGDDCPVEQVDWHESAAFANALSTAGGLELCYTCTGSGSSSNCVVAMNPYDCGGYRLLTEAEWEGAARCGEDLLYAGSVTADDVAWYGDNSSGTTHAVGGKDPNPCGLYDMSGNVFDWTQDWYGDLAADAATDPVGASSGTLRSVRGGSWNYIPSSSRVADRGNAGPTDAVSHVGFRVARSNP